MHNKPVIMPFLDPYQFTSQTKRHCDDAMLFIFDKLYYNFDLQK